MTVQTFTATTVSRRRRMVAVAASAALPFAGLLALGAPAGAAGNHNPPGNNGTIKVDGQAYDDHPGNEPHVGCTFEIDFYGFDEGDLYAQVTFNAQPPTGQGTQLLTDKVFIGGDDQSGGGSQGGLDAHREYDLSGALASFTPQPQQGYHVKLTINADGSQGADTKHKVFWVDGCRPAPPTTPDTPQTPDKPTTSDTPGGGTPDTPKKPEVLPDHNDPLAPPEPESKTGSETEVKGMSLTRAEAELPHTGVETLPLAGLGLALLGAGQAARMAVRRRED
jgi:hypothetical protein